MIANAPTHDIRLMMKRPRPEAQAAADPHTSGLTTGGAAKSGLHRRSHSSKFSAGGARMHRQPREASRPASVRSIASCSVSPSHCSTTYGSRGSCAARCFSSRSSLVRNRIFKSLQPLLQFLGFDQLCLCRERRQKRIPFGRGYLTARNGLEHLVAARRQRAVELINCNCAIHRFRVRYELIEQRTRTPRLLPLLDRIPGSQ